MNKRRLWWMIVLSLFVWVLGFPDARADQGSGRNTIAINAARERGELRWGNDPLGGAPYVFQDPMDPNHLIGFEVDLASALAKKLGVRPRAHSRCLGTTLGSACAW